MRQEVDKILNPGEIACLIENTKVFYTLHVFSSRCSSSLLEKHDLWFVEEDMNYLDLSAEYTTTAETT